MANNIAKSIINGTYGINKEEEKVPISKQILNGTFTPSSMLPIPNYYTRDSIKMGRSSDKNKALASLENMLFLTGKGAVQALEGILDTTNYLSSKVNSFGFNLLGREDLAKKEQENKKVFIQRNLTNELGDVTGITNRITENEQAGSTFKRDNLPGQVVQAVGGQIPTLVVGSLSGVGKANAALQASKMTGLTKFGTTALINAPTTTTLATRSFGGALEEAYNNGASESEAVKYAIGSTATEIATEWITGGIPGTSGKGGLDYFTDKGIDKISNQLVKDLVKYGYKMVGEGVEEGIAEIINPILKNATYSSGEEINWNDVINSVIVGGLSAGIIEAPANISNIRNDIKNMKVQDIVENKAPTKTTVQDIVKEEMANLPNVAFQYEKTNNTKINKLNESMAKYFNNSEQTKNLSNTITKIISDKDYSVVFDDTIKNNSGNVINAQISNKNGKVEIKINPNSPRAVEFLMVHEITHAIENDSMKNLVLDYAKKDANFNQALENLKQTYGVDDVSSEVLADISGQLFGNQEFINNLSTQKPNIFRQIYNKIVEIANKITGNSNEALFIRDLKQKWENAYRTSEQLKQGTTYSQQQFDVSNNENLEGANKVFFNKRDNGSIYVQALDNNNKILYDFLFAGEKDIKRTLGNELGQYIFDNAETGSMKDVYINSTNKTSETDYFMSHRPTETGAFASDISNNGELMPTDVYDHPEWYFNMNEAYSKESFNALKKIKDNPNAEITIYRATTGDKINVGDWVTLSKKYADYHNNSQFDGKGNIVELKVKAKDVQFAGGDINEFGYYPNMEKYSQSNTVIDEINNMSDFIKEHNFIKEQEGYIKHNLDSDLATNEIENAIPDLIKIDNFINNLSKLTEIEYIDTSKKSTSTYIDISKESLKNDKVVELLKKNGLDEWDINDYIDQLDDDFDGNLTIRIANHEVGGRYDMMNDSQIDYSGGDFNLYTYNLDDTQYSKNSKKWKQYLEENYKATGTRTYTKDILPTKESVKLLTPTKQETKKVMEVENIKPNEEIAKILEERPVTQEDKDSKIKKLLAIKILDKGYYVDKLARQAKNKQLSSTYDYMLQANGIAQQSIGNERFNPKTQTYEGKGLYKIFEPIENSGKLQEFSEYIYHKHNVDRMNLDTRYNESNKPVFGESVTKDISQEIVNSYEKTNPEFKEWAKEIYDYNNFLLDVLVDYGVISANDKAYYNEKYPNYVPTIRATDKTKVQMDMFGKKATVNTPIKVAKGGNENIIPLKEAMALRTMQTMNSALRNNFGNELYKTIGAEAEQSNINLDEVVGDNIDVDEFLTKSTKEKPATLTIFKDGQKTTFDISDEIYESLAPSQRYKLKIFNTISRIRRGLLTEYNPAFMLTNPIKDIQDGSINSKHSTLFLKNIPEAVKQIQTKGEYYKQYIANGGSYETYFNYGESYNKLPTQRAKFDPRRILDKISEVNQYIEMTPRLAEFISSIEAGDTIETAVYNAQEITTNFKRGGNWTKNLDANGVTFLNASVQGAVKQIRNIQEAKSQGIKGVTNLAVKWSIAGLTPYILSQLLWGDDDDYEELSDYVKNNYYLLWKNNDGTFIRIPKGRVTSVIQNLFEQPLDALKGEKIDIPEFLDLLQTQVLPSNPNENNIFSPLIDVATNKTWYGGDLVPQRLQSLPSAEQYDESTDSISIWIGQKTGISPIKINYILDQYSGALGDMILPTLTLEAENDSNSFLSNLIAPLKDKFTTNSVTNNQNVSDLYDLDDELTKLSKSANATDKDILKSKYVNSIQTEMSNLTSQQREIQNDKTLTNNEKYKQVLELQRKINSLAKEALENYNDVEITNEYARVGRIEYYKNSSNEWSKISSSQLEKLNNIKNQFNISSSEYYKNKEEYDYAYSYPAKYSTIKQITTYQKYNTYQDEIESVKDKYKSTNERKYAVINYVNGLNLSIPQKAMLIKLNYSSFKDYDNQIIQYINSQDLTIAEKTDILKQLGFTVENGRVYS